MEINIVLTQKLTSTQIVTDCLVMNATGADSFAIVSLIFLLDSFACYKIKMSYFSESLKSALIQPSNSDYSC